MLKSSATLIMYDVRILLPPPPYPTMSPFAGLTLERWQLAVWSGTLAQLSGLPDEWWFPGGVRVWEEQ